MEQSINVANLIQKELVKSGRVDRGVRQANFWVLLKTAMPSILVELDFISNPTIERYLSSKKGQHELAAAICRGICNYTGAKNVVIEKEIFNDSPESSDTNNISTEADQKKAGAMHLPRQPHLQPEKERLSTRYSFLPTHVCFPPKTRPSKGCRRSTTIAMERL